MNINIETNVIQSVSSDELDALAKHLCGIKLSLSDSGIPLVDVDSVSLTGISMACSSVYKDAVDALAGKGINVTYDTEYIRILDPAVRLVLLSNNIGNSNGVTTSEAANASIGVIFWNNTDIVNFDEFKYFTNASASFQNCTKLKSIDLTNCTKFYSDAFRGCSELTYFHGPDSLAGVYRLAEGVTKIGGYCLSSLDKLNVIYLPDSLTSIEYRCFDGDNHITAIHFGTGISKIETYAINRSSITDVYIKDLYQWLNVDFQGVVSPSHHLYLESNGSATEITNVDFTGKTVIDKNVLYGASYITDVTLPTDVTSIGDGAFYNCSNLVISQLYLPSLTSIGSNAFKGTKVQTITNLGTIDTIPASCFKECTQLTSVNIPTSVTTIGGEAFRDCNNLVISDLNLPNLTSLGTNSFRSTKTQTISDLGNITEIPDDCFNRVSTVTSVVIPNSVTRIGSWAFAVCSGLTAITIPNSVTSIGSNAFASCSGLTSVTINATTPPTLGTGAFNSTNNCPIYVPASAVSTYQSASGWSTYASRIQAIPM